MLYFEEYGRGETLVLLHPVGTTGEIWWQHIQRLSRQFRVVTVDLPGHGRSPAPPEELSIYAMAESLYGCLKKQNMLPIHLVGLSLGGMVAQTLAAQHPAAVRSMTLCNTLCNVSQDVAKALELRAQAVERTGMEGIIDITLERWFSSYFARKHADVIQKVKSMLQRTDPMSNAKTWRAIANFDISRQGNESPNIRTLVVTGAMDTSVPVDAAKSLSLKYGAQVECFEGCAHMAPLESPEKFMDVLEAFLLPPIGPQA